MIDCDAKITKSLADLAVPWVLARVKLWRAFLLVERDEATAHKLQHALHHA
jgi:hypothetical protein